MFAPPGPDAALMLENDTLLVTPVTATTGRREWLTVTSMHDEMLLGRVVVDPVEWLPWRLRWHLAAYEGPENSELFTSRRAGWAPRDWDVFDADGRLVALMRGSFVLNGGGEILGQRRRQSPTAIGAVINPDGVRVGSWSGSETRREIQFLAESAGNPFLRMAIMVAALLDL